MRKQAAIYDGRADPSTPGADVRLGPAEARAIFRRRLETIAARHGIEGGDVHDLMRRVELRSYAPGQILVPAGVRADCFGLLVRGEVTAQLGQRTHARPVLILLPGSTFGEAMLEGQPSGATLQALTRCDVWYLRRADLKAAAAVRRQARQGARLHRLVRATGVALLAVLVILFALDLPPVRTALALAPLAAGQWCDQHGKTECTEDAWQVAANLAPDDPAPLLAMGTHYHRQGDVAAAEQMFEAAGALAPDLPEVHNNLGLIYAGQGDHDRAVVAFQEALKLEPGIAATEHNLAVSLQALGRQSEALDHYQVEIALGEPTANTYVNMAIAHYELGDMTNAADAARQALETDQDLAPAYTVLGAVAVSVKRPERALDYLQRAVALDRNYGEAHFFLGLAYRALKRPRDAVVAFEQALVHADDELTRVRIRRHLNELYEMQDQSNTY